MARKDITRWDPFADLLSLKDDFDRIFRDFMGFYPAETLREGWLPHSWNEEGGHKGCSEWKPVDHQRREEDGKGGEGRDLPQD